MGSQFFAGLYKQVTPHSSITDATPPTFGGIDTVTPNVDGTISVSWLIGSSTKPPLQYSIYVASGVVNATTLFQSSNLVNIVPSSSLSTKILTLSDQLTYLVNQSQYTFGVRASDALGYSDSNISVLSTTAISSGNLPYIFQTLITALDKDVVELDGYASSIDKSSKQINNAANLIITTIL